MSNVKIDDIGIMPKKFKKSAVLCVKFLKYLCSSTFKQQLKFDIRKGKIYRRNIKDNRFSYWKVKDPFIKEYDHASSMMLRKSGKQDDEKFADAKARLRQNIQTMGEIIIAVGKGELY